MRFSSRSDDSFFLLKPCAAALNSSKRRLDSLAVLIGPSSAAFKLKPLCVYLCNLGFNLFSLTEYIISLLQNGIELRLYLFACALSLFDRRAARSLSPDRLCDRTLSCSIAAFVARFSASRTRPYRAGSRRALQQPRQARISGPTGRLPTFSSSIWAASCLSAKGESAFFQILKLVCARGMPVPRAALPPVIEPPTFISCPSRLTMRRRLPFAFDMRTASASVSAITVQ